MNKEHKSSLSVYLNSQSRNKIVFYRDNIQDISAIDLGYLLAEVIYNLKDVSKLPMKVSNELDKILKTSIFNHSHYGNMLAIENIGILLEPVLKQDFRKILEHYSISNVLFVKWEGELDNENLYFLTKENGIKTQIKNLSHIAI